MTTAKDEGVKAFTRRLQAQQRPHVDEDGSPFFPWKDYDKLILEAAEGALTFKRLSDEERAVIELGLRHLRDGLARRNSDDPKVLRDAAWSMMVGAFVIGSRVNVSDAVTKFLNMRHGTWRNKDAIPRIEKKMKWQAYASKRVSEMYDKDPRVTGTAIARSIKNKSPPAGISLPNNCTVYEFVLIELEALKQGGG